MTKRHCLWSRLYVLHKSLCVPLCPTRISFVFPFGLSPSRIPKNERKSGFVGQCPCSLCFPDDPIYIFWDTFALTVGNPSRFSTWTWSIVWLKVPSWSLFLPNWPFRNGISSTFHCQTRKKCSLNVSKNPRRRQPSAASGMMKKRQQKLFPNQPYAVHFSLLRSSLRRYSRNLRAKLLASGVFVDGVNDLSLHTRSNGGEERNRHPHYFDYAVNASGTSVEVIEQMFSLLRFLRKTISPESESSAA